MTIRADKQIQSTLQLAETCRASRAYWSNCHRALEAYGVTSVCHLSMPFTHEAQLHGVSQASLFKTSHPKQWRDAVGQHSLDHDTSVELIANGNKMVFWHEIRSTQRFTKAQRELNDAELDLGMNVGISTISGIIHPTGGIRGTGLCFRDMKPAEFRRIWTEHSERILAITKVLNAGLVNNGLNEVVRLSPRERDVLNFLAAGYRVSDIATTLHKSPKTIEKYVDSAKGKLKSPTRDNAVAKALVLGVLDNCSCG